MPTDGLTEDWQWELVLDDEGISVAHRCWGTFTYADLDLDARTGMLRCRRCHAALAVRRANDMAV